MCIVRQEKQKNPKKHKEHTTPKTIQSHQTITKS